MVFVGKRPGPWRAGPQALGWGPGPQAPWRPGPQAPGAWIPPLLWVDFLQAKFLTSCCVATIGWFLKAELYSSMRGGVPVFAPAFQPLGRAPSPCKPGLLHRLISCAQSLQPSLPFLLRRNNKVQGARS